MRILLIEDDTATTNAIELMLKSESYVCNSTDLGEDGLDIGKLYDYDLILLDLMLPDMEGLEVLRRLRMAKVQTPTMILSGLSNSDDKVKALTAGADDYLTKPFDKAELIARIQAIVRRANGHSDPIIRTGTFLINLGTRLVDLGGQRIHLTRREYGIMELLALHMGSTQTKDVIMSHLYGGLDEPEINIVDVFVWKLRKKLWSANDENLIETVWGRGYMMPDREVVEMVPDGPAPLRSAGETTFAGDIVG